MQAMLETASEKIFMEFFKALYGIFGFVLLALLGGVVSVLQQTVIFESRKFTWPFGLSEIVVAVFAGLIMHFICVSTQTSPALEAVAISIASNMGSKFVFAMHRLLCNYLKCDKPEDGKS